MEHLIDAGMLQQRVNVHLVGVGGNGAQMAACLARLDIAMRALGHPGGLHVTAFDGDAVSHANVGRQVFSPADVGQNKAVLTIHRLNLFYGLDWDARPWRYEETKTDGWPDLLISCVDTRATRRALHEACVGRRAGPTYWLDLGNTESTGQVILGEPRANEGRAADRPRLPCVTELFPEILDGTVKEDNVPSCSVRMSLASQGLFINDVLVRFAAHLMYTLFSRGRLASHGVVVNLSSMRSAPIDVNPEVWLRYGHGGATSAATKQRAKRARREAAHA